MRPADPLRLLAPLRADVPRDELDAERVAVLRVELALRPVVERPDAALLPADVRPPAERAPAALAPAARAEPWREPVVPVEPELEPERVLRVEVLPRDDAERVAEEREEEERDEPLVDLDEPPVDREPDLEVDDRRVVVAIAIVR